MHDGLQDRREYTGPTHRQTDPVDVTVPDSFSALAAPDD